MVWILIISQKVHVLEICSRVALLTVVEALRRAGWDIIIPEDMPWKGRVGLKLFLSLFLLPGHEMCDLDPPHTATKLCYLTTNLKAIEPTMYWHSKTEPK